MTTHPSVQINRRFNEVDFVRVAIVAYNFLFAHPDPHCRAFGIAGHPGGKLIPAEVPEKSLLCCEVRGAPKTSNRH
jgi:hypothetical protein